MNWEAIGAVGEVVGAVGVIVTLVYLAIQIRQNTASQRSSMLQSMMEASAGLMDLCASDPDLARIFMTGLDDLGALTEGERFRFGFLMMATLRRLESVHGQVEIGQVLESEWSGMRNSAENMMARPGGRDWWKQNQYRFRPGFARWVTGIVQNAVA